MGDLLMAERQCLEKPRRCNFTFRSEKVGITASVGGRKCLHDAVDGLRLARQADVHQQLAKRNVERVACEIKSIDI